VGAFGCIDNLSVCIDSTTFCTVGQGEGHEITPNCEKVRDVPEAQLEEKASMTKEVIGHLKVLFPLPDNAVNDTFILLDEPFLDDGFHPDLWEQLANDERQNAKRATYNA
jgi:hypothetical protein